METDCLQKMLDDIFISSYMSDKAAFVSGALLCVQCYQGNLDLYHSNMTWHVAKYGYPYSECVLCV